MKHSKVQQLQDLNQSNVGNLYNVIYGGSRKKTKIDELGNRQ